MAFIIYFYIVIVSPFILLILPMTSFTYLKTSVNFIISNQAPTNIYKAPRGKTLNLNYVFKRNSSKSKLMDTAAKTISPEAIPKASSHVSIPQPIKSPSEPRVTAPLTNHSSSNKVSTPSASCVEAPTSIPKMDSLANSNSGILSIKAKVSVASLPNNTMYNSHTRVSEVSTYNNIVKRGAHYKVEVSNVKSSSHELASKNPILGQVKNTFQHLTYVRDTCEAPNCETKICKIPCDVPQESSYIGYGTHDGSWDGATLASTTDLTGNSTRPQYLVPFSEPILNTNPEAVDSAKTTQLNNDTTHVVNVHLSTLTKKANTTINTFNNDENIN